MSNLENDALWYHSHVRPHLMDECAEKVFICPPPPLTLDLSDISRDLMLSFHNADLLAHIEFFVDNFLGLYQGPTHHQRHICCTLFRSLNWVFQHKDMSDTQEQKEVLLLKTWSSRLHLVNLSGAVGLGIWEIKYESTPPHRKSLLLETLEGIPAKKSALVSPSDTRCLEKPAPSLLPSQEREASSTTCRRPSATLKTRGPPWYYASTKNRTVSID